MSNIVKQLELGYIEAPKYLVKYSKGLFIYTGLTPTLLGEGWCINHHSTTVSDPPETFSSQKLVYIVVPIKSGALHTDVTGYLVCLSETPGVVQSVNIL